MDYQHNNYHFVGNKFKTDKYEVKGVGSMSDSIVAVFSLGVMAGMFLAIVIEFATVKLIERTEEQELEEELEDKDAELLKLAKKLNVKLGE